MAIIKGFNICCCITTDEATTLEIDHDPHGVQVDREKSYATGIVYIVNKGTQFLFCPTSNERGIA